MPHHFRREIRKSLALDQALRHDGPLLEGVDVLLRSLAAAGVADGVAGAVGRHGFGGLGLPVVRVESERWVFISEAILVDGGFILDWVGSWVLADGGVFVVVGGRHVDGDYCDVWRGRRRKVVLDSSISTHPTASITSSILVVCMTYPQWRTIAGIGVIPRPRLI
jgi:hypothetical protein